MTVTCKDRTSLPGEAMWGKIPWAVEQGGKWGRLPAGIIFILAEEHK